MFVQQREHGPSTTGTDLAVEGYAIRLRHPGLCQPFQGLARAG